MMTIGSPVGQALIDAYAAMPENSDLDDNERERFIEAAFDVVDDLYGQGFRPNREGD